MIREERVATSLHASSCTKVPPDIALWSHSLNIPHETDSLALVLTHLGDRATVWVLDLIISTHHFKEIRLPPTGDGTAAVPPVKRKAVTHSSL